MRAKRDLSENQMNTIINVRGNYMFTGLDDLFQTNFKPLQVNFCTVLTFTETNCCLEDGKNTFIILNM